ncbi:mechanosensitive ion channel family protein [Oceanibacterium hippocampi]|nr:mechanosensitive ion channel domain-containing protein [Oceanibacterium hippocampi]
MDDLNDKAQAIWEMVLATITTYGLSVLGAIVILILGLWIAGVLQRTVLSACRRSKRVDETLSVFLSSLTKYLVIAFTVIAVLSEFGVQTASLIALLGAAGLAIGLALQGTLSHIAAGVMLLLFRPFKVGDYIEGGGQAGTVKSISLFTTELATPDNVQIIVPNGEMWGTAVKNYSHHATRRIDIPVGIGYGDDIDAAMKTLKELAEADSRVLKDPAPMLAVNALGASSVDLIVRVWCNAGDYWPLRFDLNKTVKQRLDREGIEIPFPQRTVHLISESESASES